MKILVCGPAWVGDMVMAQSLFMTLKNRHDHCEIHVLAPSWSMPILSRMAEVDQGIVLPAGHGQLKLKKRFEIARQLAANGYTRAIVVPRSIKPALVPFFARIPVRTGYGGQGRFFLINDERKLDKTRLTMTVQRQVALGLPADAPMPPETIPSPHLQTDAASQKRLCRKLGLNLDRPVISFFPGAEYGPSKQWPIEYFRELALGLTKSGYQVWIFGSPQDQACASAIAQGNPLHVQGLAGQTSLNDAIDLIALSHLAVTNDSGLMHIAAALGVHVEAIYGSTTPAYTPPLTDKKTIHYTGIDCSPCWARKCPLGHFKCMKEILPQDLEASVQKAAAKNPAPGGRG